MATRTSASSTRTNTRTASVGQPEQLMLLPESPLPLQFRLDRRTRERGLAHIAELRRRIEEQAQHRSWTHAA
ncbi:MAG: hypothetical protein ACOYL9_00615 [Ilumatobacteraceae bacterium]|jgi:hypothetical protein